MTSAQRAASATEVTVRPAARAFSTERLVVRQPDANVHAAVLQVQRVRVPLRSVAEHGHLLRADQREVGVLVVEHLSSLALLSHADLSGADSQLAVCRAQASARARTLRARSTPEPRVFRPSRKRANQRRRKPGRRTRPVRRLHAARHRHAARPRHLQHAVRLQHLEQAVDLVLGARDLDRQRVGREVDDARPEHVDQVDEPGPARPAWPPP